MGDKVWRNNLTKADNKKHNTLKIVWQGPFEVLKHVGGNQYAIFAFGREIILSTDRLKPYPPALEGKPLPCEYYVDTQAPPYNDRWVVQGLVGHKVMRNGCTGRIKLHRRTVWKGDDEY